MKKNILVAVALVATLSTGAFAYNQNKGNCDGQRMQQNKTQMQNKSMHKGMNQGTKQGMHKRNKGGMQMFSQLNLTDKQKYELSILKDEMKLEMKKSRGYKKQRNAVKFATADGFDKAGFKKFANTKHTKKLDMRADFMEKAFKLLTKEQVTQLKTLAAK